MTSAIPSESQSRERAASYWAAYFHWRLLNLDEGAIRAVANDIERDLKSGIVSGEEAGRLQKLLETIARELTMDDHEEEYVWVI